jgi:two-component sensor histidine kinase
MRLHSHQQAYRAIARELSHRNKNSLAVFEAIIRKSLEGDDRRTEAIVGRLRSLSHLNDILINPSTSSLELDSLLAHEFAPYGRDRVNTRCPRIQVQTSAVKNLLLIFHELVTNAAKYGALSNSTGRIDITWLIQGNVVVMHWCEKGGPPVQVPKTQGFGSSLMRHCAAALHGSIRSDFDPKGFKCTLEFALQGKDGGQILAA